jgi:hypothetical protein
MTWNVTKQYEMIYQVLSIQEDVKYFVESNQVKKMPLRAGLWHS